jgi:hypothetical protein
LKSIFVYYSKKLKIIQGVIVMMASNVYLVNTWTGENKAVKKIALFPERDSKGEIFYKIEGQLNTDYFMISYYYDREQALTEFSVLLDALMNYQTQYLLEI